MGKIHFDAAFLALMIMFLLMFSLGCSHQRAKPSQSGDAVQAAGGFLASGGAELTESDKGALAMAIDDEYKARAAYRKVIKDFGEVMPFPGIAADEDAIIDRLKEVYDAYNEDIPADEWKYKAPEFGSIEEACAAAAESRKLNARMYDELISIASNPELKSVFALLRDESRNTHIPALEIC